MPGLVPSARLPIVAWKQSPRQCVSSYPSSVLLRLKRHTSGGSLRDPFASHGTQRTGWKPLQVGESNPRCPAELGLRFGTEVDGFSQCRQDHCWGLEASPEMRLIVRTLMSARAAIMEKIKGLYRQLTAVARTYPAACLFMTAPGGSGSLRLHRLPQPLMRRSASEDPPVPVLIWV